jgi:cysteine-rich repeat protein
MGLAYCYAVSSAASDARGGLKRNCCDFLGKALPMSNRKSIFIWLTSCGLALYGACLPIPDDDDDSQGGAGGEGMPGGASGAGGADQGGAAGEAGFDGGGDGGNEAGGSDGIGGSPGGEGQGGSGGSEECPPNSKLDSPRVNWLGACTPIDLSDDGSIVLAHEGIWSAESGWSPLPELSAEATDTPVLLSGDGKVVFGCSRSESGSELYRWTAEAGITGLGAPCPFGSGEYADTLGTNADGSTLVTCGVIDNSSVVLRWTPNDGFQVVEGTSSSDVCLNHSVSLSSNGVTLVADRSLDPVEGFLYIESSTTVSVLRDLVTTQAMVSAVSGDGRVVADYYKPASLDFGASIDADLCLFPRCPYPSLTVVTSLNHDGSVGIGVQEPSPDSVVDPNARAQFYWTSSEGMRHMSDAFFDHDVYLDVGTGAAQSIMSDDGTTVVGVGTRHHVDASSSEECFLATFGALTPSVPATLPPVGASCGDGTVDDGEACDDGNQNEGDACTSRCERPSLASGHNQTCWLQAGRVACWGEAPSTSAEGSNAWSPAFVTGIDDALQLAARGGHACALRADGGVSCWGDNSVGQLGDGTTTSSAVPVNVSGITSATGVAVGDAHSCALLADGTVQCWGDNTLHQLGDASNVSSPVPVPVVNLGSVTQLVAGGTYSCALLLDRTVQCWGEYSPAPATVAGLDDVRTISGSDYMNACALRFDGELHCWEGGDPALGTFFPYGSPPADLMQIAVSGWDWIAQEVSVCVLTSAGTIACSGANASGQLGSGERGEQRLAFELVHGLQDAVEISAGGTHFCARLASGQVHCWGNAEAGQLGIGFKYANSPFGLAKPAPVALCP